jgi:hypothetical protein
VFSSTGRFIRSIGSFGVNTGQFQSPLAVAADASGDVYVADDQEERVSKFSPSGHFEWSVGGPGTADAALAGHFDTLSIDAHDRVVAAVDDSHTIVYIDAKGNKVDSFGVGGYFLNQWGPCGAALTPTGNILVESCPGPGIGPPRSPYLATLLFDPTHCLVGAWYHNPFDFEAPPRFGSHNEVFALASTAYRNGTHGTGGAILRVKVTLPGE